MTSVVVNESVVRKILSIPELQNIGCLKDRALPTNLKKRGCGKCGKKRKNIGAMVTTSPSLTWAKRCLYGLSDDALKKVKASLSVDRLVFYFHETGLPQRTVR